LPGEDLEVPPRLPDEPCLAVREATSTVQGIFINPVKAPARKQELGRLAVQFSVDVAALQLPIQCDSVWRWLVEGKFGPPQGITGPEVEFGQRVDIVEFFE